MGILIRSKMGFVSTLLVALASILDGLIGLVTLGYFIGGFRHTASLAAARRAYRQTLAEVSSICEAAERGEDISDRVARLPG